VSSENQSAVVKMVLAALSEQSPEALTKQSDLVVMGHYVSSDRCSGIEGQVPCSSVAIDEVLAGVAPGNTVRVSALLPGDLPEANALLFLRRVKGNHFELVAPHIASSEVDKNIVRRHNLGLEEVRRRVKTARTGRQAPARSGVR
jgi:hypothetical protein